jgi:hypothetical protein
VTDLIRGAVIHLSNEQPLVADLFAMPTARDTVLVCTNLRTTGGKRPVFADHMDSVFYFPIAQIRFLEVPPGSDRRALPAGDAVVGAAEAQSSAEPEADLEIDEDFLRRIREA